MDLHPFSHSAEGGSRAQVENTGGTCNSVYYKQKVIAPVLCSQHVGCNTFQVSLSGFDQYNTCEYGGCVALICTDDHVGHGLGWSTVTYEAR